jgi:hypothetical protein
MTVGVDPCRDPPVAAGHAALRGGVAARRQPGAEQILRGRGVEAARHGILDQPAIAVGEEGAELRTRWRCPQGAGRPDRYRCRAGARAGGSTASTSAAERRRSSCQPGPLLSVHRVDDRLRRHIGKPRCLGAFGVAERAGAGQRRGAEGQDAAIARDRGPARRRIAGRSGWGRAARRPPPARHGRCRASDARQRAVRPPGRRCAPDSPPPGSVAGIRKVVSEKPSQRVSASIASASMACCVMNHRQRVAGVGVRAEDVDQIRASCVVPPDPRGLVASVGVTQGGGDGHRRTCCSPPGPGSLAG